MACWQWRREARAKTKRPDTSRDWPESICYSMYQTNQREAAVIRLMCGMHAGCRTTRANHSRRDCGQSESDRLGTGMIHHLGTNDPVDAGSWGSWNDPGDPGQRQRIVVIME